MLSHNNETAIVDCISGQVLQHQDAPRVAGIPETVSSQSVRFGPVRRSACTDRDLIHNIGRIPHSLHLRLAKADRILAPHRADARKPDVLYRTRPGRERMSSSPHRTTRFARHLRRAERITHPTLLDHPAHRAPSTGYVQRKACKDYGIRCKSAARGGRYTIRNLSCRFSVCAARLEAPLATENRT